MASNKKCGCGYCHNKDGKFHELTKLDSGRYVCLECRADWTETAKAILDDYTTKERLSMGCAMVGRKIASALYWNPRWRLLSWWRETILCHDISRQTFVLCSPSKWLPFLLRKAAQCQRNNRLSSELSQRLDRWDEERRGCL